MREMKSLDEILGEFHAPTDLNKHSLKGGKPMTIWLPAEYKDRYAKLQYATEGRFCKKLRELIKAAIEMTEAQKTG